MGFEEMKRIWDSLNQETLYAINEATLHTRVRRRGKQVRKSLVFFEWVMMLAMIVTAGILAVDAIVDSEGWHQYLAAAAALLIATYTLIKRIGRQKKENRFDESVVGEVNRAISQLDYLIERSKNMLWWYTLPMVFVFSISFYMKSSSLWVWVAMFIIMGLSYWGVDWEIRCKYLPKKRELESIKKLLLTPES